MDSGKCGTDGYDTFRVIPGEDLLDLTPLVRLLAEKDWLSERAKKLAATLPLLVTKRVLDALGLAAFWTGQDRATDALGMARLTKAEKQGMESFTFLLADALERVGVPTEETNDCAIWRSSILRRQVAVVCGPEEEGGNLSLLLFFPEEHEYQAFN